MATLIFCDEHKLAFFISFLFFSFLILCATARKQCVDACQTVCNYHPMQLWYFYMCHILYIFCTTTAHEMCVCECFFPFVIWLPFWIVKRLAFANAFLFCYTCTHTANQTEHTESVSVSWNFLKFTSFRSSECRWICCKCNHHEFQAFHTNEYAAFGCDENDDAQKTHTHTLLEWVKRRHTHEEFTYIHSAILHKQKKFVQIRIRLW